MRLREWIIWLPADWNLSDPEYCDRAIEIVRDDLCSDICFPDFCYRGIYDAWIVPSEDNDNVWICVTRLSSGNEFPRMQSGYCWVGDGWDELCAENAGNQLEVYTPNGLEGYDGMVAWAYWGLHNHVDSYNVWECADGKYRAQLVSLTGY